VTLYADITVTGFTGNTLTFAGIPFVASTPTAAFDVASHRGTVFASTRLSVASGTVSIIGAASNFFDPSTPVRMLFRTTYWTD